MPKFVTVKKAENERQQAAQYLKTSLVYPSALMGLIGLVFGYGGVIYLMIRGRPMVELLTTSLILLSSGLLLGLLQALYQHYLFRSHQEVFSDRIHRSKLRLSGRVKKIGDPVRAEHKGRWAIPYIYLAGWAGFVSLVILHAEKLNYFSAIFLVLAGFHNARFFYLKRLIPQK